MIRSYMSNSFSLPSVSPPATVHSRAGYSLDNVMPEDKVDFRRLKDKKLLYILYRRDSMCSRLVDVMSSLSVARGFKIIPKSKESLDIIHGFLKSFHPTDPVNALLCWLKTVSADASWSGDGWAEKLYSQKWNQEQDPYKIDKNTITGIRKLHPLTMDFMRETTGEITIDEKGVFGPAGDFLAYHQVTENGQKKRDVDKRRIMHLTFKTIGDEITGISDLESIYKTRHRGMSVEDGIARGAFRHGVPFFDVVVGDESHPPDKPMMDAVRKEVKNSSYLSEYVHPPWYKVDLKEQFSLSKSEGVLKPFIDLAIAGSGIPGPVLMGSGEGTNKATIKELVGMLPDLIISPRQRMLKLFLEEQLFYPLMKHHNLGKDEVPLIQWNEVFPPDSSYAQRLNILSGILIENKPLISWVEAREMMHLPSDEKGRAISALSRETQFLSSDQRGIYLVPPHGNLIHEGHKKAILSLKRYPSMLNIPLVLVSGNKAYGIIKLTHETKINEDDFKNQEMSHRVSEDEADKWWPGWREKGLYSYDVSVVDMYKKLKPVKVPQGTQKFMSDVQFLNSDYVESIDIFSV